MRHRARRGTSGAGVRSTRAGFGERVAQKQVTAAAPRIDQVSPEGSARRKCLAHHEAEPPVTIVTACDLRRERQELLVDQSLRKEISEQTRTALDEDSPAAGRSAYFVEDGTRRNRTHAPASRAYLHGIR